MGPIREIKRKKKLKRLPGLMNVNELKKKWVANIFRRRLQDNEISLLRKGLNFAISSHRTP